MQILFVSKLIRFQTISITSKFLVDFNPIGYLCPREQVKIFIINRTEGEGEEQALETIIKLTI